MDRCGPYEVVIDSRGQALAVGARLAHLTGQPAAELVGKPVSRWLRGALVAGAAQVPGQLEVRSEARPATTGTGIKSIDGERIAIVFVPEPMRASHGDAKDQRDLEPRLQEVGREVLDALTGIIGFAGLMPVAPTPHRRKFYVDQVITQAERVRRLALVYRSAREVRPNDPGTTPIVRATDLGAELTRALSPLRASLERGGIAFDLEIPSEPVWAACDVRQIGDLVTALVQRATVQQRRDYQANEIVLRVQRGQTNVVIDIVMTGADQPHVLLRERFGTDEASTSTTMSEIELRMGLLALRRQGGLFAVAQDAEREEVTLTLTLPSGPAAKRADKLRTPVPLEILVVDDDAMLGELYQEMLQVAGHTVVACRSLSSARDALRGQRFDAIVAEFQLKDGLLSELWAMASQAHPELASRLIVATRDARDPRLVEWASPLGTPILMKPFSAAVLQEQLALLV